MRQEPRLQFTKEERAAPALEKPIRKADRTADKAEKARAKIPKKKIRFEETVTDPATGKTVTRLRFEVKDSTAVDEKAVKAAGAAGVIRPGKTSCQVVIGPKVQFVYDELKKML